MYQNADQSSPSRWFLPLSSWERAGLALFLGLFVAFGAVVEMRSAFMQRRMTDLGVYLRAGWAVRAGADLYDVTDDNGWHFQYPPLFAILIAPLADPPDGFQRAQTIPYAVSVAVWYALSILLLAAGVHCLADSLERVSTDPLVRAQPRRCRRWWALRVLPVLACLPPIGHTLMRGQVNILWLALLCASIAAMLRGRRWSSGLWLSGAVCLKVLPLFLIIVPIWRRDLRCLAGLLFGLLMGLVVVPSAAFGVPRTVAYYQEYATKLLLPGLGQGSDQSRAKELIEMTANDSQSLLAAMHNSVHLDRATRPPHPSEIVRWANRIVGGILTLVTVIAAGMRTRREPLADALFLSCLIIVMLLVSPVCHLHYFCLELPLLMLLLAIHWDHGVNYRTRLGSTLTRSVSEAPSGILACASGWYSSFARGDLGKATGASLACLIVVSFLCETLPNIPGLEVLRDLAAAMYPALFLWAVGCAALWRYPRHVVPDKASVQPAATSAA